MELDELRPLWRRVEAGPIGAEGERREILILIGRKSYGPVARMRRNLLLEGALVLLTYVPAIFFYIFGFGGRFAGIAWPLSILLLIFIVYSTRKDKLLQRMLGPANDVRVNLHTQVRSLEKYVWGYTVAGTLLAPVMAILSLAWIFGGRGPEAGWVSLLPWVLVLIPVTIACYYLNTWHVRRVYGRHIRRLREILDEMDEV